MIPVLIESELPSQHKALEFAEKFGWQVKSQLDLTEYPTLFFEKGILKLNWRARNNTRDAFYVDFLSKENRHTLSKTIHKEQVFKKAIGLKSAKVLDMTAGFAGDSLLMCRWGHKVTALESHPVVFLLTYDAIRRVLQVDEEDEFASKLRQCIKTYLTYEFGDSCKVDSEGDFDFIYIDPMFPEKRGGALSPKPMQVLNALGLKETNLSDYMTLASRLNPERLVIKRPAFEEPYLGRCTHSFGGKSIRYDMYDRSFLMSLS